VGHKTGPCTATIDDLLLIIGNKHTTDGYDHCGMHFFSLLEWHAGTKDEGDSEEIHFVQIVKVN
jgi:hypothetical protein